ncbi:hypothetical protein [Amycolatopsis anabasis]|uniref:hypothetical protein n=1 Tax=Amycolatopsis anabasis TaxID=1840409 RepID=UPI00131EB70C|nr:hypothetical protein [Amycolatopsis anabasis]
MADGDSGSAFLQSVVGGLGDAKQVNAFADGAKDLLGKAKAGGWAISEEGGAHFLNALKAAEKQHQDISKRLGQLQQAPMLGNDQYAQTVASHVLTAMDSDEQSLVQVMLKFREGLDAIREAIETAKKNYNAADEAATKRLGVFKD